MYKLHVQGMRCGGCASKVGQALKAADDAAEVEFDVPQRLLLVHSALPVEHICEALQRAGFPATPQE